MKTTRRIILALAAVLAFTISGAGSAQEPIQPDTATATPSAASEESLEPAAVEPAAAEPAPADERTGESPVSAEPATGSVARETAAGALAATHEASAAVRQGGTAVTQEGQHLWQEILLPTWQRLAGAIPGLVKALVVLALFWLLATLIAAGVRRLLKLTRLDDKAAQDWGLGGFLSGQEGHRRSLANVVATFVKWIILLFGFVAFFQALRLEMVAQPLQHIVDSITGVVPNLLAAVVILIAYWIVASVVQLAVVRGLGLLRFDERAGRFFRRPAEDQAQAADTKTPSQKVGRLTFFLILLFGLAPFLAALGQSSLVAPLTGMLGEALAFLPRIFAALLLFFIGRIIATIVREILGNFLAASGTDTAIERWDAAGVLSGRRFSAIVGELAYFFILIPVIVASLDTLEISAISEPVQATLQRFLAAVPLLFVAFIVVAVGYFLARACRRIVETFLAGVGVDELPKRLGLDFLQPKEGKASLSSLGGSVVLLVILLLTAQQALDTLGLDQLSALFGGLLAYLPDLFIGLVIILAALSLGAFVARLIGSALGDSKQAKILVPIARWSIVFLGFSMGLAQLGVSAQIVGIAVAAVLGGAALALGLAFGLGGRDRAKAFIEEATPRE